MERILENQALLQPVVIETFSANYILETKFDEICDICSQNGKLYIYLRAQNVYLPISKVESA